MDITIEWSLSDFVEKGMGLAACAVGCVYAGTILQPEIPLKALRQASLYATLGLAVAAVTPRTYCWLDTHMEEIFDQTIEKVQNLIDEYPFFAFAATATVCAIGCFAISNPIL